MLSFSSRVLQSIERRSNAMFLVRAFNFMAWAFLLKRRLMLVFTKLIKKPNITPMVHLFQCAYGRPTLKNALIDYVLSHWKTHPNHKSRAPPWGRSSRQGQHSSSETPPHIPQSQQQSGQWSQPTWLTPSRNQVIAIRHEKARIKTLHLPGLLTMSMTLNHW